MYNARPDGCIPAPSDIKRHDNILKNQNKNTNTHGGFPLSRNSSREWKPSGILCYMQACLITPRLINRKKGKGERRCIFYIGATKQVLFSYGPNSLKPWFLGKELLLSIDRHVVTKNEFRISVIHFLVFFLHQLWCRIYGGLE